MKLHEPGTNRRRCRQANSLRPRRNRLEQSKRRSCGNGESRLGASTIEFAIVANIMMIMVLTCMEFARMNMVRNLSQDAAYFAARIAIVPGATAAEAEAEADRIMGAMVANGYTVTVSNIDSESSDVSVTIDVNFNEVAMFAPFFLPDSTISSSVRMRTERYEGFYEQ